MAGTGAMIGWDYLRSRAGGELNAVDTIPLTSFPGDETQPSFSPNGEKVAFVWAGENNDNSDIYIRDMNNSAMRRLTTNAAEDLSPGMVARWQTSRVPSRSQNETEILFRLPAGASTA